jgi:hypothetical protein
MDGIDLNVVDATQETFVDSPTEQAETNVETVNADNVNFTTDKHEETKPTQSAEENAKYASIRREYEQKIAQAEQKAINAEYSRLYGDSHGIHSKADYDKAVELQEQEQQKSELLARNFSEEDAAEVLEARKLKEELKAEKESKQQQEQQQADMQDFIKNFPDVKPDDIPVEVWKANANGIPLRYAYAEHALKSTRTAEVKAKANEENAKGSMGSVSTNGTANDGYFTKDQVSKMTSTEVVRNYEKICESTKKW